MGITVERMRKTSMKSARDEKIYYVNQTALSRRLFHIQMCGITYPDKSYEISRENSAVACLEYIEKGAGVLEIDGQTYTPAEGDSYLLGVGTNHHYYSDKRDPWQKVFINVSESLYSYITKGMNVDVEFDALPDQKFAGKVSRITPMIDPQTRTFEVEVTVANAKEQIKPGMYARVAMNYGSRKNIVVPDVAVVKQLGSGDRYIYVYQQDGTVEFQKVELGRRMGGEYEILSGIADGAEVVTSGQVALRDGIAVERVNE